jgi:pilus assembly protein Flp/PilA
MQNLMKLVIAVQLGVSGLRDRAGDRQRGATAVEYGLMVALIAIVIIAAVFLLGTNLSTLFNTDATSL